jgi:hypothetical protein
MPADLIYRRATVGRWRLVYLNDLWNQSAQKEVLDLAESQPFARHPQTVPLRLSVGGRERAMFLKTFHPSRQDGGWKDSLRRSKAYRAWRSGLELRAAGFAAPVTVALGEARKAGFLRRAFALSEKIDGLPAHVFLRRQAQDPRWSLAAKRAGLRQAAELLRRFHGAGFVHGDLVATNLFIAGEIPPLQIYFMDNDRTRRYPRWLPQPFWKRNLIQLNRMPLAGVTLQDRIRFFKAYCGGATFSPADRALARWLEQATRRRRAECDGVDSSGNFRRLMRDPGDISPPARGRQNDRRSSA